MNKQFILSVFMLVVCVSTVSNVSAHVGMERGDSVGEDYAGRIASIKAKMADNPQAGAVYHTLQMRQMARAYSAWALELKNAGNYPGAANIYDMALREYDDVDSTLLSEKIATDRFTLKMNQCELYLRRGMFESALNLLENTPPPNERSRCIWLHHQAEAYTYLGEYDKALERYRQLEGTTCYSSASLYANQGYLLEEMGRHEEALRLLRQAKAATTDENVRLLTLGNEALLLARIGKYDEAIAAINECLSCQRTLYGDSHPDVVVTLRKRAEIMLLSGKKEATDAFRLFFDKETELLASRYETLDPQSRLDLWYTHKSFVSECFSLELDHDDFLYDVALFRRGMTFLRHDESPKSLLSLHAADVRKALPSNGAAIELVVYERDSVPYYGALVTSSKSGTRFVRLFPVSKLHNYPIGDGTVLDSVVSRNYTDKNGLYTDKHLAQMVWEPISQALPTGIKQLWFAPDGIFHQLAIEYMPYPKLSGLRLHRVVNTADLRLSDCLKSEECDVLIVGGIDYSRLPSATDSLHANHAAADYLITLDSRFRRGFHFPTLSHSRSEVDSLALLFAHPEVLYDANETYVKQRLPHVCQAIFSTHGYSFQVNMPRVPLAHRDSLMSDNTLYAAGLAMSGARKAFLSARHEDGLLSAREIIDMPLDGLELVVLSACQTAQGYSSDEGPAGVLRGLKKAGAKTVLATLWPVYDPASELFMLTFFQGLHQEGLELLDAFLRAQETVRRHEETLHDGIVIRPYEEPAYWAPFILVE
ncbi:MAG: CHAT domain-containing protein [Prevotella sp.]|nr:CHAT domain-containing protein [Prevotella sp.]